MSNSPKIASPVIFKSTWYGAIDDAIRIQESREEEMGYFTDSAYLAQLRLILSYLEQETCEKLSLLTH